MHGGVQDLLVRILADDLWYIEALKPVVLQHLGFENKAFISHTPACFGNMQVYELAMLTYINMTTELLLN